MSLFPCISSQKNELSVAEDPPQSWLQSSSFKPELIESLTCNTRDESATTERNREFSGSDDDAAAKPSDTDIKQQTIRNSPEFKSSKSSELKQKRSKRERKHRSESKKKKKKSSKHKRSVSPPRRVSPPPLPRKVFIEEIRDLGYKDAYRLDRKADRDNYAFQSLNKKHVSRYRSSFKIPYGASRRQSLAFGLASKKIRPTRYYSRSVRSSAYNPGYEVSKAAAPRVDDPSPHIIILPAHQSSEGERTSQNPLGIFDEATLLWSQGKAPKASDSAENLPSSSYLTSSIAQKIAFYNSELRGNPGNVPLWIELINIQDGLLDQRTEDDSSKLFTAQLIHEKKLAVVAQAISKNPSNLQLKLKQLELSGKTMDWQEMNEEWRKLTFTHVNDIEVWKGYLRHVKTSFTKFTVGVMMKAYTKCIRSLRQVSQGMLKSHPCKPDSVEHMLEILLELCDLLHLANCTEKAVAVVQAMIEFNMYRQSSLDSHEAAVQSFQDYYDSGVPRFGEPGAKGWCSGDPSHSTVRPAPLKPTVAQDEEEEERLLTSCQDKSRAESWLSLEQTRQTSHWLPWRPAANEADDDCDDPHRLVLSDDFVELLFYIEDDRLRKKSYFKFLNWLGMQSRRSGLSEGKRGSGVGQLDRLALSGRCPTAEWHEYILHDLFIAHCTDQMMKQLVEGEKSSLIEHKLFYQLDLVQRICDKKERKKKCKEFRNYAKSILSLEENRHNHPLWLCYADCIRILGLPSDMNQVHDVLMSAQEVITSGSSCGCITPTRCELWWRVVSGETEQSNPSQDRILSASCWLVCGGSVSATAPSPSQKLLLMRGLETELENLWGLINTSAGNDRLSMLTVFSYAVTCYYTTLVLIRGLAELNQAVYHWMPQLAQIFQQVEDKQILVELYLKTVTILKYTQRHLYQSCTPLLRSVLQTSLTEFPACSALLREYLDIEKSAHVTTRVRQFFTSSLSVSSLSQHPGEVKEVVAVHSVLFELDRLQQLALDADETDRGINNRIRSLCKRCLTTLCPNSVLLWRLYLYHEAKYGSQQQTESLFYAAIQACPYAKCLYTDGIQYIPGKLGEIIAIAEGKEVRIHTPIEELEILLHRE